MTAVAVAHREGILAVDDCADLLMGPDGSVVGELALLSGGRRTATITAIDTPKLIVLDRREFLPFLKSHPEVAIKLLEVLAERQLRFSQLAKGTTFLNLPARLAKNHASLSSAHGIETPDGIRIDLELFQAEIGDLVAPPARASTSR